MALLIRNKVAHPYVDRAAAFCRAAIAGTTTTHPYEAGAIVRFLDAVGDEDEAARIGRMVRAAGLVLIDPDRPQETPTPEGYAEGEMHRPYDYAPTPDSLARRWFTDAEMETALDRLEAEQQDDGGWPIHFLPWAPGITLEWRPVATIQALKVLRGVRPDMKTGPRRGPLSVRRTSVAVVVRLVRALDRRRRGSRPAPWSAR